MTVAQATPDIFAFEDLEEVAKRRAKLAAETIASFDAHTSYDKAPITSYDLPVPAGAAYLSDVAARPTRECRGIRPGVVRIVYVTGILMVSRTGGNATQVAPRCVMIDSGAQPVMIGKKLAQNWGWRPRNWLVVHLPLSHPLVTWSGPQVILESHYSLASE